VSEYDAVLVFHANGFACGVTKFSQQLAQKLGVPCELLDMGHRYRHPLISIKTAEIGAPWNALVPSHGDFLFHDRPEHVPTHGRIFYADELGCPSTVDGNATRGAYRVLAFGMSHKLVLPHFQQLKRDLDRDHPDYTIELSTAVHEGNPWDEALSDSVSAMRGIFGERLRVLGFLADDALARILTEVDAVAAFYVPALRRNNTSAWAAIEAGKTLFTNRDQDSPSNTEIPNWNSLIETLKGSLAVASMTR
jgi:hypothetical protein